MNDARRVAQQLAARFLEKGNYSLGTPMKGKVLKQVMPAAAPSSGFNEFFEGSGFEGLAVQSRQQK